ncbi:Hypothetical predicted protein [Mytilus galloprovincialis]|uniref:Uncharacterized protein n=1 Tax=Mytilus galloprovincialis TaxID=29158 RepID=A0A8B6CQS7_MYTGA|nr:Hypothetical predicted protein [Mytilus galloprovincialis]
MVYTKQDKHGSASKVLNWHHHTFYFRPSTTTETINLGNMTGNTGILFDDVKIQETILHNHDEVNQNGKHIHAHVVAVHQWSSIHASWSFIDPECPIVDYMWAIGYSEGSTEVKGFTSVGLNNFAYNYNISLAHTSVIHITVIATNAAGLRREAHAKDIMVSLKYCTSNCSDIDAQTTEEVSANWEVHDDESGIDVCEWAVGYQPYGNEIQTFKHLSNGVKIISKVFPSSQVSMQMIHVTLRCKNEAGLQSSKSSNGVKISSLSPNTTSAEVQFLPHTLTEYNPRDHYQGDTSSIRVKLTGFEDLTGLDSYLLTFQSHDKSTQISKSIISENQDMSYCLLEGLDISNGNYSASVNAVNKMYLRSSQVSSKIVVSQMSPSLIASKGFSLRNNIVEQFDNNIVWWCKQSVKIEQSYSWLKRILPTKLYQLGDIALYIWLGTCNLTTKTPDSKYINLTSEETSSIEHITKHLENFKKLIAEYPQVKLTFLEIPVYSIKAYNQHQGHTEPLIFRDQDKALAEQIHIVNQEIRNLNQSINTHSPDFSVFLKARSQHRTRSHRDTWEYFNFNLYRDGIHPSQHLAQVWLREIAKRIKIDCWE